MILQTAQPRQTAALRHQTTLALLLQPMLDPQKFQLAHLQLTEQAKTQVLLRRLIPAACLHQVATNRKTKTTHKIPATRFNKIEQAKNCPLN
jgi:hypothetical protein